MSRQKERSYKSRQQFVQNLADKIQEYATPDDLNNLIFGNDEDSLILNDNKLLTLVINQWQYDISGSYTVSEKAPLDLVVRFIEASGSVGELTHELQRAGVTYNEMAKHMHIGALLHDALQIARNSQNLKSSKQRGFLPAPNNTSPSPE